MEKNAGFIETKYLVFAQAPEGLLLESGQQFGPITLAYETYGQLNNNRSNAILILHALSGDSHVAGYHKGESKTGWWEPMVGPGKPFDTNHYFVICSNILGGCRGSTGPSSVNPVTGKPYGLTFPIITVADMVNCQRFLVEHLGIKKIYAIAGGSMGGMQVLQWVAAYPEMVQSAIPVATTLRHSAQQIAFDEVGRQAIMSDPDWSRGDYYGKSVPAKGLALARMIGHITYMSDASMEEKFGRRHKGLSQNKVDNLPEAILERDKERRSLRTPCGTEAMSDAVAAQNRPGPSGSPIFGSLRRCSSTMCHSGHRAFVAPCTNLKSGTPNSQLYSATAPNGKEKYSFDFTADFEVEGYLRYKGDSFVQRFDANSYLYITKAMDFFDLIADYGRDLFRGIKTKFLVLSFSSDWLYPPSDSEQIVRVLKRHGAGVTYCEIPSDYGHDAFLVEMEEQGRLVKNFLDAQRQ
ncbi:MAG: homoserine O-acetyltransferase [Candidatus Omnitrophota bacterium]